MSILDILAKCPLAKCLLVKCPLAKCPLAKCPGFGKTSLQLVRLVASGFPECWLPLDSLSAACPYFPRVLVAPVSRVVVGTSFQSAYRQLLIDIRHNDYWGSFPRMGASSLVIPHQC